MGCSVSGLRGKMPLFGRNTDKSDIKVNLEQKLYLAKESPEPVFDLSECQLKQVPSGIFSICKVFRKDQLLLNDNQLKSLDNGGLMSDLYLIKVLNISCNKFSQLHGDIKYLVSITELYVQDNELTFLPHSICNLQNLRILDVSKNNLQELTTSLGKLKNLRKLNIKENVNLTRLCPELCQASNLQLLDLDCDQFIYPPSEIATLGIIEIMIFLCKHMNLEYTPPLQDDECIPTAVSPVTLQNPFNKEALSWEQQEMALIEQESRLHEVSRLQREQFMSKVLKDQLELDAEIVKVQELKEIERQQLIKSIQQDEKEIEILVNNFIQSNNLNPEDIQQQLEHEQAELDRLLTITKKNNNDFQKHEILKAMERLVEDNCAFKQSKESYDDFLNNIKRSMLAQQLESSEKLESLLRAKDQSRTVLVEQLLEDQDIQKAIVASLLERVDVRSWSLNQEISLITSNLARLSQIEQEKQKLHVTYNYNQLLHQRVQLINLLDDLLEQQNKRRRQLVQTLKEIENETDQTTDFWLNNYQKLIDSAPKTLLDIGKVLDPQLANILLQEGVIHCLPFLVKFLFSEESLLEITEEKLKENGVRLSSDRKNILKAIQDYMIMKTETVNMEIRHTENAIAASAPLPETPSCHGVLDSNEIESSVSESECVICMDAKCEVVFVPCGHLCCCYKCSENDMQGCPMCRGDIERKIKVLIP